MRRGDDEWFAIVKWTVNALIEAEELGITQARVDGLKASPDPAIQRFLGSAKISARASASTANGPPGGQGGRQLRRDLQPQRGADSPLKLPRGLNAQWNKGGHPVRPAPALSDDAPRHRRLAQG